MAELTPLMKRIADALAEKIGPQKPFKMFSPQEWGEYGMAHGVPNLGPMSNEEFQGGLKQYKTKSGKDITIPGGVENTEAPFTYYDLLHLKNQGINPNDLEPDMHKAIHNRMINTMQPKGELTDPQVFNQLAFGMISPNQPLTPNELALARVMAKSPEDIDKVAGMIPWKYGDKVEKETRQQASRDISKEFGLHAGERGGLGTSGSADYTRIAEMAQMMRDKPDFFRFKGEGEGAKGAPEQWLNFVNRIGSQVPGLSAKTGSLATVWQDPANAAISAIDRHMATEFKGNLFDNPAQEKAWQENVLSKFNEGKPKDKQVSTFEDMLAAPGGRGVFVDNVLAHVNNHGNTTFRSARTGEINPNVPEAMANVDWVKEPEKVMKIAPAYLKALDENESIARQNNQGLFANQWMLWDRIRNRLEPHEVLFPGLEKLPRMDMPQMKDVRDLHSDLGYMAAEGAVKEGKNPSGLAYFTVPPAAAAVASQTKDAEDKGMKKGGLTHFKK